MTDAWRVVSLDLDGTLCHPAVFNAVADALGFGHALEETTRAYFEGWMTAEQTFEADYRHFVGRDVREMQDALRASTAWTPGIAEAVARWHAAGARVVVTTDQPHFLADVTRELFGVDAIVCTTADVRDGKPTGTHDARFDKWENLAAWLAREGVDARRVAHVGNGANDVPVFERVGLCVAVFAMTDAVRAAADVVLDKPASFVEVADAVLDARVA